MEGTASAADQRGMATFWVVWFGQLVSLVGSAMTGFGLAIWVFVETGSATRLGLVLTAIAVPRVLAQPFVGTLVDRWDRRVAMIVADAGAAAGTAVIAALVATGNLEVWHLYPTLAISSVFGAFQFPAYSAAITLLVPKDQYGRAAGLVQLADAVSTVVAPFLAGVMLGTIGVEGIIVFDLVSFVVALLTLVFVRFPAPPVTEEGSAGAGSFWSETRYGFAYLAARHGLAALVGLIAVVATLLGFVNVLFIPLVLAFSTEEALGAAVSLGAVGLVIGSLVMSAWGGPAKKTAGVLGFMLLGAAGLALTALRPSLAFVVAGLAVLFFSVPIINGCNQVIFQLKVHPDVQGRVFAIRRLFGEMGTPIAYLAAGILADELFEPLLAEGGSLAGSVGDLIGTGEGRGVAFMFLLLAALMAVAVLVAAAYRPLREVETILPDAMPDPEPTLADADAAHPDGAGGPAAGGGDARPAEDEAPEPAR